MEDSNPFPTEFQTTEQLYDSERSADLKAMSDYETRVIKRLQDEIKALQSTVDQQLSLLDSVNAVFAETPGSKSCTSRKSLVFKAMNPQLDGHVSYNTSSETMELHKLNSSALYQQPTTEQVISALQIAIDFDKFFLEVPIACMAFFDQDVLKCDLNAIIAEVEKWDPNKRTDFFTSLFEHMNSASFMFNSFLSLTACQSLPMLTESIETGLSRVLNYNRIAFFLYDTETGELVMEKQKLQMRKKLHNGIISKAIESNQLMIASPGYEHFSSDDGALLKRNSEMLVTPVHCDRVPAAVILMFDKIGGLKRIDFLMARVLSLFIEQSLPIIRRTNERKANVDLFQGTLDAFLKVINSEDIETFMKVVPETLSNCFECEYVNIFRISQTKGEFWPINHGKQERCVMPLNTGITGDAIARKLPVCVTMPEYSSHFSTSIDRPQPKVFCSSILVCPVLDAKGEPKFAIALYNKKEMETFTDLDISSLKMICDNLYSALNSVIETGKLTMIVENGQERVNLFDTLTNMLPSLGHLTSISMTCEKLSEKMREQMPGYNIDMYYLDKLSKTVKSEGSVFEKYEKSIDDEDPVSMFTKASSIQESVPNDDSDPFVYCGVKNTSDEPIGCFRLSCLGATKKQAKNAISTFLSAASIFSLGSQRSIGVNKSTVQLKVEKLNTVRTTQYRDVSDANLLQVIKAWRTIIGPSLEASLENRVLNWKLNLVNRIFDRLPVNPALAARLFDEMQLLISCCGMDETSSFIMLPRNNEIFLEKTRELITGLSGLCEPPSMIRDEVNEAVSLLSEKPSGPDDTFSATFSSLNADSSHIYHCLEAIASEVGVLSFLEIDKRELSRLLNTLQEAHPSSTYKSWRLAVDSCQFFAYIVSQVKKIIKLQPIDSVAIYFYLLTMYAVPYQREAIESAEITRFYVENGRGMTPMSSFFSICSGMDKCPLRNLDDTKLTSLLERMLFFDKCETFECMFAGDLALQFIMMCKYSYLARKLEDSQKWVSMRFKEEVEEEYLDEFKKYQLDFEIRSLILPTCGEFVKRGVKFDHIRKMYTGNVTQITGNNF